MTYTDHKKIAEINDAFRQTFTGGRIMLTSGVMNSFDDAAKHELFKKIQRYNDFNKSNDPYGEHDFGIIITNNKTCFWKIDYYDPGMKWHSDNPANIEITIRVLTIMLADEY